MLEERLPIRHRKQDLEPLELEIAAIGLPRQRLLDNGERLLEQAIGEVEIRLGQRIFLIDAEGGLLLERR